MRCTYRLIAVLVVTWMVASGCTTPPGSAAEGEVSEAALSEATAIRAVLDQQVVAWNAGNIEAFMEGYAQTDSLRFASRGSVRYGWQTTLEAYQAGYPDRAAMGRLAFDELDVRVLGPAYAMVFGGWRLTYPDGARPEASGLFTLIMERRPAGWRVVHDHTSAAP
ncbi:MAG: SgcJ/EcaC family oxidoreductase [Bacteroidota bacterium]